MRSTGDRLVRDVGRKLRSSGYSRRSGRSHRHRFLISLRLYRSVRWCAGSATGSVGGRSRRSPFLSTPAIRYATSRMWLLAGLGVLATLGWCALHLMGALSLSRVPVLPAGAPATTEPTLSVVIPARNEIETLEAAVTSLLKQDYPDLQLVLVDDRSDDGTGDLVDRIAASSENVIAVHVAELPSGWLGKVNALRLGMEGARGDYVLFTDADVHFSRGSLRAAMNLAVSEELDHLTLLPRLRGTSLLHGALMHEFFVGYIGARPAFEISSTARDLSATVLSTWSVVMRSSEPRASTGFAWTCWTM